MVPEGRAIFANLTVLENLEMGAYLQKDRAQNAACAGACLHAVSPFEGASKAARRHAQRRRAADAGDRPGPDGPPRLLLLDEPSLGLAPILVHTIFGAIDAINKEGTTILLVEQNANAALRHSHRAYVLETGTIVMEGPSEQLAADPRVKEAYLGEK